LIYCPAAILLFVVTRYAVPHLAETTGQEPVLFWFLCGGVFVFLPLIIAAVVILKAEGRSLSRETWSRRMRFGRPTRVEVGWASIALVASSALSAMVMKGIDALTGGFDHTPVFMTFEPLTSGRYWLLLVWFPYWVLNILGEEILWRGVMLPRQEIVFGRWTWLFHGFGWALFHIAFGWQLLLTLVPLLFVQSYAVQRTRNSWVGVMVHGAINGPSFIAIALGLL
jgi:membrane protease YdiL (CAAX protease family)